MLYLPENVTPADCESMAQHYKAFINFFRERVQHYRDNIYMRYYTNGIFKTLTYGEVDRITTNLACKIIKLVPAESETIALVKDHDADSLITVLSVMKIRKALFTISPRNSEAAIVNLMEKTNAKFIMSSHKYENTSRNAIANLECVGYMLLEPFDLEALAKEPLNSEHTELLDYKFSDEDIKKPTIILHSSGTTSFPKPMFIGNQYIFNLGNPFYVNITSRPELTQVDETDVLISLAPLFHVIGFIDHFLTIFYGASIVFLEKLPPSQEEISYALSYNKVSIMLAVPVVLEQMVLYLKAKNDFSNLKRMKYIAFGGAALKDDIVNSYVQNGVHLFNVHGLTEAASILCADTHPDATDRNAVRPHHPVKYYLIEQEDPIHDPDLVHVSIRAGSPFLANNACNRSDGGFDTNDLFRRDPERPGYLHYVGRRDDTLVMTTGEKTNPLPMEATLRTCPLVKQAAVLGHERLVTCALIELNTEYAKDYSPQEIVEAINNIVSKVNKECPTQSTILPDMINILPFKDTLPVTVKGSLMRRRALAQYQDTIDHMYDALLNTAPTANVSQDSSTWTVEQTESFLVTCASDILKVPVSEFHDTQESIFNLGFNSINIIRLRNRICEHFDVSQNFLYQHSTIRSLSEALLKSQNGSVGTTDEIEQKYQEAQDLAVKYIEKAKRDFDVATTTKMQEKVVLLTGATGSIGSFILSNLLQDDSVKKVYCLVRGASDRLVNTFTSRFLDVSLLDTDRLEVLPMKLNDEYLGLTQEKYHQLRNEVTIVQHCAWLLDFNMPIDYYDKECIAPFYHLLEFACRKENPMHVHFISSVSASALLGAEVLEEPLPLDSHVAMPMGYAQSKFVVEVLLNYLTVEKNVPCYIERVGQVSGDSVHGVWNTAEQYPLMFVGGGSMMHKMPALDFAVDWIPVDYAAKSIVDIMLQTADLPADITQSIYHIVNPTSTPWSDVLEIIKETGITFDIVSTSAWVDALSQEPTNPCYRLISFYENNFGESLQMPTWKTDKTRQVSTHMNSSPVFNVDLFKKYLNHWQTIGFYNPIIS